MAGEARCRRVVAVVPIVVLFGLGVASLAVRASDGPVAADVVLLFAGLLIAATWGLIPLRRGGHPRRDPRPRPPRREPPRGRELAGMVVRLVAFVAGVAPAVHHEIAWPLLVLLAGIDVGNLLPQRWGGRGWWDLEPPRAGGRSRRPLP